MKNILLLYGNELSHNALKDLINADSAMHLVEEVSDAGEAIAKIRAQKFDVVILDVSSPEKNGLETFCDLKQAYPSLPILIINGSDQVDRMANFTRLGCRGYLSYTADSAQVIPAIKSVARGQSYLVSTHEKLDERDHPMLHERLSLRELQVFFKLIKGQPVNSVAEELSIAPGSVSVFRSKILKKMNMNNNASLIHYALDHHLIS
ncbi:response regulator [Methylophilus flavus]|jgi:DNA-binding NarL/FixJ family response regulator|uniref:Response regulator n=1 Tax=Methylophilus flavus TaxID=640084 RepID=A0ABW3P7D6_9PROT